MKPAARIGDMHICPLATPGVPPIPHVGGPVALGEFTVLIGFMPAARMGDMCVCVGPPDAIAMGSPTVLIGMMPAARMGDPTMHGGMISVGCPTVLIGESGGGGGAAGGGGAGKSGGGAGAGKARGGGPAAGTSTSGVTPSNGPFDTIDAAGRAALDASNANSIKDNVEYSGLIYEGKDGKFYFTGPVKGTDQGANPYTDAPAPTGTKVVGDYHTHGDYSTADPKTGAAVRTSDPSKDDFNSDNFSNQDKLSNAATNTIGYLGTPSGTYRRYDPATGNDTTL